MARITAPQITYVTAVVFFVLDRWCKAAALKGLSLGSGWVMFRVFRNSGIAFSLPLANFVFWPLAGAILLVLLLVLVKSARRADAIAPFLALIVFGALSNLADRLLYGGTIDYAILFHLSAVNLADAMIVTGVLAVFLLSRKMSPVRQDT